jgi:hypothetical protein
MPKEDEAPNIPGAFKPGEAPKPGDQPAAKVDDEKDTARENERQHGETGPAEGHRVEPMKSTDLGDNHGAHRGTDRSPAPKPDHPKQSARR